jgi:hypothetical protein
VLVGAEELESDANALAGRIRGSGHDSFVVRLDTVAGGQ